MKNKKKVKKNNNDLRRLVLVATMLVSIIVAMVTYWIFAYHHKYYGDNDNQIVSFKVGDYTITEGNIIYLKNISKEIETDFVNKQKNIINKERVIDTNITKNISKNILSIKIIYTINKEQTNYEEALTLNIDLKNKEVLSSEEVLNMVNSSYKEIATEIFDDYIKLPDSMTNKVIDAITEKELSAKEFNQNREKYIIRIREKLPEVINTYINNSKVYYLVRKSEIDKVCYYINNDVNEFYIEKEIGKL